MKARRVVRLGKPSVTGLHTMAPVLSTMVFFSDGSYENRSERLTVEPSRATLNLRYLHDARSGNCVGCFDCTRRDETLKLFI